MTKVILLASVLASMSMLAMGAPSGPAGFGPAAMIPLRICQHATGKDVTNDLPGMGGVEVTPPLWVDPTTIYLMAKVENQDCTIIITTSGRQVVVIGTPKDIACRVNRGPACE